MNELEIKKILDKEPLLTNYGIGSYDEHQIYNTDIHNEHFKFHRAELYNKGEQIAASVKWLRKYEASDSINRTIGSSEVLKTYVEKEHKIYVTNGAFIAALIYLNIPYDSYQNYPHVDVGLKMILENSQVNIR